MTNTTFTNIKHLMDPRILSALTFSFIHRRKRMQRVPRGRILFWRKKKDFFPCLLLSGFIDKSVLTAVKDLRTVILSLSFRTKRRRKLKRGTLWKEGGLRRSGVTGPLYGSLRLPRSREDVRGLPSTEYVSYNFFLGFSVTSKKITQYD